MNHFQRLNEVKELNIFFFAQHAKVPADQIRAGVRRPDWAMSALRGTQQTSKYITTVLSIASPIVGPSFRLNRALRCSACPNPPPLLLADSRLLVEQFCVTFSCCALCLFVSHTHIYITFLMYSRAPPLSICYSPNTLCDVTYIYKRRLFPIPVMTHGFSSKGVAAVRARRLFSSTTSRVRGSSPVLPLGRKLPWQPGFGRASLDCHVAISTHYDVFFFLNRFPALPWWRLGLAFITLLWRTVDTLHHTFTIRCITLLRRTLFPRG